LKPDYVECLTELGCALQTKGFVGLAIKAYRKALALNPELGEAHDNLGNALRDKGELDEAVAHHQRAIVLMPKSALAQNNLGSALLGRAELDVAITAYKRALELKPDYADAHSNLILALLYRSGDDDALIASQCRAWSDAHVQPHRFEVVGHANERSPERRLRIGYVSGDLRRHPVGYFLQPLLEHHDRGNFEVYGYSNSRISDEHTKRLRGFCDVWRDVVDLPDEQVASQIRADAIDVLIDLGAHTRDNRLMVLARKPAPVQVAHLAYPARIGLESIDYRFTDPYLDPPGEEPVGDGERILRLPHTYWCYVPPMEAGEIAEPPMSRGGFITFGCLNNFAKVSPAALEVWRKILVAVPESHLLLHALEGSHRDRVWEMFSQAGIDRGRVSFVGWMSSKEHMEQYQRIDVALDPFPFAGGTTTCNALWMGVPVVTLAGRTSIGRGGVSILSNVGLTELIAGNREEYVRIAAELAGDGRRLNEYRATMREKMQKSPLMDGEAYAQGIERAYRELWRRWCSQPA
jgi:predicted O-linked N-acetylglucosamine transferase (SPINDLY family)